MCVSCVVVGSEGVGRMFEGSEDLLGGQVETGIFRRYGIPTFTDDFPRSLLPALRASQCYSDLLTVLPVCHHRKTVSGTTLTVGREIKHHLLLQDCRRHTDDGC